MNNSHFCLYSNNLFDFSHTIAAELLQSATYPWEVLPYIADFIRKIGKKIATTHISDRDDINERHWLPGEGIVDWISVMDALGEVGYEGNWIYETGLSRPKTILRDRDMTFDDLVRNAKEVFARQKPTIFSKPKPGVGMWE